MPMPATSIIGAAGAYFAAGELSAMDWAAALTVGNSPRADLVAKRPQPREAVAIQVKTSRAGDFQIGTLAEREPSPSTAREWFVLVALQGPGNRPVFYVAPWNHVGAMTHLAYQAWLNNPGRGGRKRKPHGRRALAQGEFTKYREAWDLLDDNPHEVDEGRLPDWVLGWYDELGLPDGFAPLRR